MALYLISAPGLGNAADAAQASNAADLSGALAHHRTQPASGAAFGVARASGGRRAAGDQVGHLVGEGVEQWLAAYAEVADFVGALRRRSAQEAGNQPVPEIDPAEPSPWMAPLFMRTTCFSDRSMRPTTTQAGKSTSIGLRSGSARKRTYVSTASLY